MPVEEANLDLALRAFEGNVDRQFSSIDSLSTKTGVTLGFTLTVLAALSTFGFQTRPPPVVAWAAYVVLTASALLLAYSYSVTEYASAPKPSWLLGRIDETPLDLKRRLVANLAFALETNADTIQGRFRYLNAGIALFLIGVVAFVLGALLS